MHLFLPLMTTLLGSAAVAAASNPIMDTLVKITASSNELAQLAGDPRDIDLDRQYQTSVRYFVKYLYDLDVINNNFPTLASRLNLADQVDTCGYYDRFYYRNQTNLAIKLKTDCNKSGIKGSWCNYLVVCLRDYMPLVRAVEDKVVATMPFCNIEAKLRAVTIGDYQDQAVKDMEKSRYYIKLPWTVPQTGEVGDLPSFGNK